VRLFTRGAESAVGSRQGDPGCACAAPRGGRLAACAWYRRRLAELRCRIRVDGAAPAKLRFPFPPARTSSHRMRILFLVLAACGPTWVQVPAGSARSCAPTAAADKTAAAKIQLPGAAPYGRYEIEATARDSAHVYALGRFMAISDSLENDYAYLLRSDDHGAT